MAADLTAGFQFPAGKLEMFLIIAFRPAVGPQSFLSIEHRNLFPEGF